MNSITKTIVATCSIFVIMLCAVLIATKMSGSTRVADLTKEKVYTLSDGTKKILGKVNGTIKFKFYYTRTAARKASEQIRFWNSYAYYVKDLLREYEKLSGGKITLEVIDPRPFSDEEEEATRYGVKSFRISENENFFFGLVAATEMGKDKVIDFFKPDRQEFVEYDITKLISDLIQRDKRKIGIISALPILGDDMSPYMMQMMQAQGKQPKQAWVLAQELKKTFETEKVTVGDDATIAADIDYLMVVHPKNLDEKTLFAIDQYVMNGGKLAIFVDPHCMADPPPQQQRNPMGMPPQHDASSNLNALMEKWGVTLEPKKIAVDRNLAQKIPSRNQMAAPQAFYPLIGLTPGSDGTDDYNCFNKGHVISGNLKDVRMLFAGKLKKAADSSSTITPLIQTTTIGSTWEPSSPYELMMPDAERVRKAVSDGTEPVMLACHIGGKLTSNFPEGIEVDDKDAKPKDGKGADAAPPAKKRLAAIKECKENASIVVFADVDMITDQFAYRREFFGFTKSGDGSSMVMNTLDFLGGDSDLISIRTRGRVTPPFKLIKQKEREAQERTQVEVDTIKKKIEEYQTKLSTLGASATDKNIALIQDEAVKQRRQVEEEVRVANKRLRKLQATRREDIEKLQNDLKAANMIVAPAILVIIAVILFIYRIFRAKRYASMRLED